jgi:hypothetical protein
MTEIDYEALAKAAYDTFWEPCPHDENGWSGSALHPEWDGAVRAAVAALWEQGLVVVRAEVFRGLVDAVDVPRPVFPRYLEEAKAALAAPVDGGEPT